MNGPPRRISVWLDGVSLARGAFAHGLEWAAQLHLPLQVVAAPRRWWVQRPTSADAPVVGRIEETLEACGAACARVGVAWGAASWDWPLSPAIAACFQPTDLWVFGAALPEAVKVELLRQSEATAAPLLVCPQSWQPAARFLILHEPGAPASGFLLRAVQLCKAWRLPPVILTVARSQRAAQLGQDYAEEIAARQQCPADFDSLVGADIPGAAAQVAQWRRRTHVIVERRPPRPWRPWLGDSLVEWLGLSECLTFLALPGGPAEPPSLVRAGDALRLTCPR